MTPVMDTEGARDVMTRGVANLDPTRWTELAGACGAVGLPVGARRKPALLALLVAHFKALDAGRAAGLAPAPPAVTRPAVAAPASASPVPARPAGAAPAPAPPAAARPAPRRTAPRRARVADPPPGSDGSGSDDDLGDGVLANLRASNVTKKKEAAWAHRGERDVYTLSPDMPLKPCVDHVLEIQVAHRAMRKAAAAHIEGVTTRAMKLRLQTEIVAAAGASVNGLANLNVTSSSINMAKMGPFKVFSHRLDSVDRGDAVAVWGAGEESLGGYAARHGSPTARALVDDGTWERIERAVDGAADAIADGLAPLGGLSAAFAEELVAMVSAMRLAPRAR